MQLFNTLFSGITTNTGYALASSVLLVVLFGAVGVVEIPSVLASLVDCGVMQIEPDYSNVCV